MNIRLTGKVVIITGATSGIGEVTAREFINSGASVILAGRSEQKGEKIAEALGERAIFQKADVTRETEIRSLIDLAVGKFGRLDCLFNNAGGQSEGTLETVTPETFDNAMRLLLGSVVFGIKHAAIAMKQQRSGCIINNSSVAAIRVAQGGYLYSCAKAGVTHLTKIAGVELGPFGIRVNSISPGAIATPIFFGGSKVANAMNETENNIKLEKLKRNLVHATPLNRAGLPEDIARTALFLLSDEGSFITCQDIVVDGGRTAMFHEAPRDI